MKYRVSVCRVSYAYRDLEVDAETRDHAVEKAIEQAGNLVFHERTAELEADPDCDVEEIQPDEQRAA